MTIIASEAIRQHLSDKLILFCRIEDVYRGQFGYNVVFSIRMGTLWATTTVLHGQVDVNDLESSLAPTVEYIKARVENRRRRLLNYEA